MKSLLAAVAILFVIVVSGTAITTGWLEALAIWTTACGLAAGVLYLLVRP